MSTYRVVCVANIHDRDSKTLDKVDIITACSWLLKPKRGKESIQLQILFVTALHISGC